jgi:hypothetical protein
VKLSESRERSVDIIVIASIVVVSRFGEMVRVVSPGLKDLKIYSIP